MKKAALVALILALAAAGLAQSPEKAPHYEIYAVRYASVPGYPVAGMVKGADPARKFDIAMYVWLIKGNGRNILLDSGFYREKFFRDQKIQGFLKPSEAVALLGVKPEEITDVIISHMHWDHADGLDLFPRAKIWIQKDEYAYYTGDAWQQKGMHGGIDPEDVLALVKANTEGRVNLVNGDAQEVMPGITCYIGGKHTYQSQYVSVTGEKGTAVLASDNIVPLRKSGQARPHRGHSGRSLKPARPGPHEAARRRSKTHHPRTRPRRARPLPQSE